MFLYGSHHGVFRFIYRHSWSAGDLVICDNRSCVHRGRAWRNPAQIKRQISLVKIAEGGPRAPKQSMQSHDKSNLQVETKWLLIFGVVAELSDPIW